MKMKNLLAVAALTVSLSGVAAFAAQPENVGTVNITVLDENGALVPDAPVYIYGEQKTKFTGGKDVPGTTTLTMLSGNYRISSAIVKKTGDYLDRFASNEAHIQVIPGDNTVVVLTLKPLEDAVASIGYAELHKMGVSSDIARNLN
jgi:opacity protein-like surface antigen